MGTQPSNYITPDEYLKRERAAETRSEYYQGEMFAMSGASRPHSLIVGNLAFELMARLRNGDCEVHTTDMRLLVSSAGLYAYPDVMVVCGEPVLADTHGDILTNPRLIIEVLSPSTQDYDRGRKCDQYMRIPSLVEYLTVSQSEMLIEQRVRQLDQTWLSRKIAPDQRGLSLHSLDITLDFADIYRKVPLNP